MIPGAGALTEAAGKLAEPTGAALAAWLEAAADALGGQPEGFGDAAAGGVQHAAEGAHLARGSGQRRR